MVESIVLLGSTIRDSRLFSGLRLPVQAMLDGKLADVLAAVQQGVQTPEHAAFVAQLQARP